MTQKFHSSLLIANGTSSNRRLPWAVGEAVRAAVVAEQQESAWIMLKSVEEAVRAEFPTLTVITIKTDEKTAGKMLTDLSRMAGLVVLGCDQLWLPGETSGRQTLRWLPIRRVPSWRGARDEHRSDGAAGRGRRRHEWGPDRRGRVEARHSEFANRFGVELHAVHTHRRLCVRRAVTISYLIDWEALETAQWR